MKSKLVIIVIMIVLNIQSVRSQTASELWNRTIVSTIRNASGISYSLTVDGISYGETFNLDTVCHVTCTPTEMRHTDGHDGLVNLWITRDKFVLFNRRADDIVYGSVWKDSTHTVHSSEFNLLIYPNKVAWGMIPIHLPLYFAQWNYSSEKNIPESYHDTTWNSLQYWVFSVVDHSSGIMDGDRFIPNDDSIFYFVNKMTNLVDRVDICSHNKKNEEFGYQYERYIFHNVKILDSLPVLGDKWNIDSPIYTNTPKYNIYQSIPSSLAIMRPQEQYKVTDQQILDYPLLAAENHFTNFFRWERRPFGNGWSTVRLYSTRKNVFLQTRRIRMKARIIRTFILTIALLPTMSTFRYLDKECFFLGHSMLNKDNLIRPLGIKVLLHTSCPCAIELMDTRNNGISCYFSWIPNLSCTPQPKEENRLLSYLAGDSNILLCEEDSKGAVCYKVLKRGKDSFFHEEKVSNDEAGKLITEIMTPQNSWTNLSNFDTTIDARDCCLHLIIILVLLLIIEISGIILTIRRRKMSE